MKKFLSKILKIDIIREIWGEDYVRKHEELVAWWGSGSQIRGTPICRRGVSEHSRVMGQRNKSEYIGKTGEGWAAE